MKLALIPPKCFIDDIFRTDYQLVVPGTNSIDSYREARKRGDFIILDNGAPEGKALDNHGLLNLAVSLMPQEIVIPDVMQNMGGTLTKLDEFESFIFETQYNLEFSFMGVVQGDNMNDIIACLHEYNKRAWIHTIGIPRHLIDTLGEPGIRATIATEIHRTYGSRFAIHLLGTNSNYIRELSRFKREFAEANVRGVDTSAPFNYANVGKFIDHWDRIARPGNYFDLEMLHFSIPCVKHNIEVTQEWVA